MSLRDELHGHLSKYETAPFLFVGSGMSRRYIQSETWAGLLSRFAAKLDKPYAQYASAANGDFPTIATELANDFHPHWFASDDYALTRIIHSDPQFVSTPLKIEISEYVKDLMRNLPVEGREFDELEILRKSVIQGIITTNYDPLLEHLFPELEVYVGQEDLLFSNPEGVGEIYKIHGSYSNPDSLVLTQKDYENFGSRNAYLAAKLLTIFVEHPVVFLGYSLSDKNVREILMSIAKVLTKDNIGLLQNGLIFVQWDENATDPRMNKTVIPMDALTLPIIEITVSDYDDVFLALSTLKERLPLSLLRRVKKQVTELVQTSAPKNKTYVMSIDDAFNSDEVDVVIGIGVHNKLTMTGQGIVGRDRYDLLRDIINPSLPGDIDSMKLVVSSVLPKNLPGRTNTPIYKYLRSCGYLNPDGTVASDEVPTRVQLRVTQGMKFFQSQYPKEQANCKTWADGVQDFSAFLESNSWNDVARVLPYMDTSKIDMEMLHAALKKEIESKSHVMYTPIAKVICIYDLLEHQKEASA